MNNKNYRFAAGILFILITFAVSINKLHLPSVNMYDADLFSALNVEKDIKVISKEPHSVEHPLERSVVRDYLQNRLLSFGDSVVCFFYDSIPFLNGRTIDIGNIYGVFEPEGKKPQSYLLMIAHLDSRSMQKVKGQEVYSKGAADDGYGLGVILELLRVSGIYKKEWNQGLKVLFTDSEEFGLHGISKAFYVDNQIFENVGLVINFEARGVKGPAVLFETSSNNGKIIDLYNKANVPVAYSLTSAVYNILPNYTDFTVIKNDFPGMNFSVVDNLNYYHTELDNFDNISLRSIQHYGVQTEIILREYLTKIKYSDTNYLKSDNNKVYFSLPIIGLITFGSTIYLIINFLLLILFLIFTYLYIKSHKITLFKIWKIIIYNFLFITVSSAMAFLLSKIIASVNDLEFKVINLAYIEFEYLYFAFFIIVSSFLYWLLYSRLKSVKQCSILEYLVSALSVMIVLSFAMYLSAGDSVLFFVPMTAGIFVYLASYVNLNKIASLFSIVIILLFSITLFYLLTVALAFGSLFIINILILIYLWLLFPMFSTFVGTND